MILNDEEIRERIESPLNLMNRLRSASTSKGQATHPGMPPKSGDIIPDVDDKLEIGSIRKTASRLLSRTLKEIEVKIPEAKINQLAQLAKTMNDVVTAKTEREEDDKRPQIIVYAPQVVQESSFQTLVVQE